MLIPKVERRIKQYLDYLEKNAYRKISDLEFEIFEADKTYRLPPEKVKWEKISCPASWGKEWTYFWFRCSYTSPKTEKPLFLSVTPNADSLAFIDGKPAGAFNRCHQKIRIEPDGKEHTLHIESYTGHSYGGRPLALPLIFKEGCLLERSPAVYSLCYDIFALYETSKFLSPNSLRKAKILKGLSQAIHKIDLTSAGEELEKQAKEASVLIAPLLSLKNGPTVPSVHLIGHAHIDHAWLWPISETEKKAARTFSNMARFAREYPEFIFIQSQPCQLEIMKNEYPDVYNDVREAFKNGSWEPNGGMWVESDTNVTSGESLVRQFLVGKKANKELLGDIKPYEADTLWLPDVFGYSASLPQIMAGCRIKYFVTSKINWNDTTRFPYDTFIWRGTDGTGIKTHFLTVMGPGSGYNGRAVPEQLNSVWENVQHKEVQSSCLKSIGEGDGGGGTFRADLELARRLGDLEGCPRSAWKTASAALDDIFSGDEKDLPEWKGELYLELHRGTYTTQGRTKRNNRLLEAGLRRAEIFSGLAALEGKGSYPYSELLDIWKTTLTNQFHDIIPGSSIGKVYTEAEEQSAQMLEKLAQLTKEAQENLVQTENKQSGKTSLYFFNDLGWERNSIISYPAGAEDPSVLTGPDGKEYPVQHYNDFDNSKIAIASVKIPSLGWAGYSTGEGKKYDSGFKWQNNTLDTKFYRAEFNGEGGITNLFDKRAERELVSKGGLFNKLIFAEDVPADWDAWDIDADWVLHIKDEIRHISSDVAANGVNVFRLRSEYKIGSKSRLVQDTVFYADDPRIDFETKLEWHEKRRLLKAEFDTNIKSDKIRCEIQYGHIWRNTHKNLMQDRAQFEICAHKWVSLEEEGAGLAILNNCKYGHDAEGLPSGSKMRITLLRSPIAPDADADQGTHYFTYALLPFSGSFAKAGVIQSAYELNYPVKVLCGGSRSAEQEQSLCSIDGSAVIIECVKAPEDGSPNELVMRLYESLGGRSRAALRFSRKIISAAETDMLEENPKELAVAQNSIPLEFRAFEIKTIRVKFN